MNNFETCLALTLKYEGGYTDNPFDPGGATNLGITRATLSAFRRQPVSKADVKNLTHQEAAEIYTRNYWHAIGADELPSGVDMCLFDFAVNSGVGRATSALRMMCGAEPQGHLDAAILMQVRNQDPVKIIENLCLTRLNFLRRLRTFSKFGRGWSLRVAGVRAASLQLAAH